MPILMSMGLSLANRGIMQSPHPSRWSLIVGEENVAARDGLCVEVDGGEVDVDDEGELGVR